MTTADSLKPLLHSIRAIPGQMGLRPHRAFVRIETWSGSRVGEGTRQVEETEIIEGDGYPPKIRWLKNDEIAVGNLSDGSAVVGPITPQFTRLDGTLGGFDASLLRVPFAQTATLHIRIVGPQHPDDGSDVIGALYKIVSTEQHRAMQLKLTISPVDHATP